MVTAWMSTMAWVVLSGEEAPPGTWFPVGRVIVVSVSPGRCAFEVAPRKCNCWTSRHRWLELRGLLYLGKLNLAGHL